jgi:hypothetical protein
MVIRPYAICASYARFGPVGCHVVLGLLFRFINIDMEHQNTTLKEHYQFLAYAKQEATDVHKTIYQIFKTEQVRARLKDSTLQKMRDFFTEFLYLSYEVDLLTNEPSLSDGVALNNLLSEVDCLVTRSKAIIADVKFLISKN